MGNYLKWAHCHLAATDWWALKNALSGWPNNWHRECMRATHSIKPSVILFGRNWLEGLFGGFFCVLVCLLNNAWAVVLIWNRTHTHTHYTWHTCVWVFISVVVWCAITFGQPRHRNVSEAFRIVDKQQAGIHCMLFSSLDVFMCVCLYERARGVHCPTWPSTTTSKSVVAKKSTDKEWKVRCAEYSVQEFNQNCIFFNCSS